MINQINFHLSINVKLQGKSKHENVMIISRLSVKFCQLFPNKRFANATYNKFTELIESGSLMINTEILFTKYKKILENYI